MAFRPKISLLGEPPAPPGQYYEDTLENFLKPRLDKGQASMVDCISSGELEAPHKQEAHEETQKSALHT